MATYLDTSALAKLCTTEAESLALRRWLADAPQPLATSIVGEVELVRSMAKVGGAAASVAETLRRALVILPLSPAVAERARRLPPGVLRSLDAIHVATALELGEDLTAVVSYDQRMIDAATAAGLEVVSPGRD